MGYHRVVITLGVVILSGALFWMRTLQGNKDQVRIGTCTFTLERPRTTAQYAKGLSGRDAIATAEGMWFVFDPPQLPTFWMKGMRFSIDIVWIVNNKVVGLNENVLADDGQALFQPPEAVDAVLEIAAGRSRECDISKDVPVL